MNPELRAGLRAHGQTLVNELTDAVQRDDRLSEDQMFDVLVLQQLENQMSPEASAIALAEAVIALARVQKLNTEESEGSDE